MAQVKSGIVSKVYGAWYEFLPLNGNVISDQKPLIARLRGRLRLSNKKRLRHLIIVGDEVNYIEDKKNLGTYIIEKLIPRSNMVQRSNRSNIHGLGANLDRAILLVSLRDPLPRPGFIDRFLIACVCGEVEPLLLFSKSDLLEASPDPLAEFLPKLYQSLGFEISRINLLNKNAKELTLLEESLLTGNSLLCGSSGTGKSTFLNLMMQESIQKTSEISLTTRKGRHTTTNSSLFVIPGTQARIIDSPGVKEWGLSHLDSNQILLSYPELSSISDNCYFSDCLHTPNSKDCAIQEKITKSREEYMASNQQWEIIPGDFIHPLRIRNLNNILSTLDDPRKITTGDYIKTTGRVRSGKMQSKEI